MVPQRTACMRRELSLREVDLYNMAAVCVVLERRATASDGARLMHGAELPASIEDAVLGLHLRWLLVSGGSLLILTKQWPCRCGSNNSAMFAEIVPEELRSTIYAFDRSFEGGVAAMAMPLVGERLYKAVCCWLGVRQCGWPCSLRCMVSQSIH